MKYPLLVGFTIVLIAGIGVAWKVSQMVIPTLVVTTFEECASAGNPIMESYPRRCRHGDVLFTEVIGNELAIADLIRVDSPRPNQIIKSPLVITGQARGTWFFEASFPVALTDSEGNIVAQGVATSKGNWMTPEFVPFEATLTFAVNTNAKSNKGVLLLKKDNPSGLPQNDKTLEIPILFSTVTVGTKPSPVACTMEAKICPDGSGVGRTGPNCEFSACPAIPPDPIGKQCAGPSDTSCPLNYECVQACGPPVVREDTPPAPYYCQLKGYIRTCPICLAKDTLVDTLTGKRAVQDLQKGDFVWTVTKSGKRVLGALLEVSKTAVPLDHKMVNLVLLDGRTLLVSPGHLTTDGRTVGELVSGDRYDGSRVVSTIRFAYDEGYTYDILPSGETGFYFAGGILLDSTLH